MFDPDVATITARIQDGAMAFLMAEYRMLSIFIVVVAALLFVGGEDNGLGLDDEDCHKYINTIAFSGAIGLHISL